MAYFKLFSSLFHTSWCLKDLKLTEGSQPPKFAKHLLGSISKKVIVHMLHNLNIKEMLPRMGNYIISLGL